MQTEPEPKLPRAHWLLQFFGNFRFIMVLAVVACLGSAVLLVVGTIDVFTSIWNAVSGTDTDQLKVTLIDTVDTFMVATVLMVIAFGLDQLFVNPKVDLPSVLQTRSFGELENVWPVW